ncbi:hypothetical protein ABIE44_002346 [Marmoricola sp. OAE513]|uniref:hypothetical protein n=1 Tax=Marmoricola sp. OAE513 TaxID=2817894 RepID=UPI001AE75615
MQRVLGLAILLVFGMLSLPLAALGFDEEGSENWILPVQLGGMAAIGALVALAIPRLAREGSSPARRAVVGAGWGLLMAVVGVATFFLILNGFDGA